MRTRAALVLWGVLGVAACSDSLPTADISDPTAPGPPGRPVTLQELHCRGDRAGGRLECAPPGAAAGADANITVGGQNVFVRVQSSNVAYNGGTGQFSFDVTLQNLIPQPMGTTDGVTLDPGGVRIFFHSGPSVTGGTGVVAVVPDGFATFTAVGQPYYQYDEVLANSEISAARGWTLVVPPSVETFEFTLYVSAPVPHPDGYISINDQLPGYYAGDLHPGSTLAMTAVSRTAVGTVVPGTTITFGTSDPLCATVSGAGVITGVRSATCDLTATDGTRSGYLNLLVTGTTRVWSGAVSPDWSDGGNWAGALAPAAVDSVLVPNGTPNYPALVANTQIGGVTVEGGATLSLGAFDLTASASVATGAVSGGILATGGRLVLAGADQTVRGILPRVLVTGSYSLSERVAATATQQVDAGLLLNPGYQLTVTAQ